MSQLKLACLGPAGTHSESAVREAKLEHKEIVLLNTISAVFDSVATKKVDAGVVPIENFIEGPVSETLDQLLQYKNKLYISGAFVSKVEHAFGILPNSSADSIKAIYSHPQVLRQCSKYLEANYPAAAKCAMESSAGAMNLVSSESMKDSAVIGKAESLSEFGFQVTDENIEDSEENKTRFIIIKSGDGLKESEATHLPEAGFDTSYVTSILIEPEQDRAGLLFEILTIVSEEHRVNIRSIHSRPDLRGGFVFFLELEGHPHSSYIKQCIEDLKKISSVDCDKSTEILITGSYQDTPFLREDLPSVAVIGAQGKMGGWFCEFFSSAGLQVLSSDKNSKVSSSEIVREADIVILSIPMDAISEVLTEIKGNLKPGTLIVENCSVKENSISLISSELGSEYEVLGLHTMFNEKTKNLDGENIVVTRTSNSRAHSDAIVEIFRKKGASISFVDEQTHDSITALVQSLVHLLTLAFGQTAKDSGLSSQDIGRMSTPNSRVFINVLRRIVAQKEELLIDIQLRNSKAHDFRGRFLSNFFALVVSLFKKEPEPLKEAIAKSKEFLED